jgi:hypothetical protein
MVTKVELFESPDRIPLDIFFFVCLDEERSLQKKGGHTRRIARSHVRWCCYDEYKEYSDLNFENCTSGLHLELLGSLNLLQPGRVWL